MPYKQCKMRSADGSSVYVAWLPVEFAKLGKIVDLKNGDDSWDHGWEIKEVYSTTVSDEYIREHERDYKDQRKASDI